MEDNVNFFWDANKCRALSAMRLDTPQNTLSGAEEIEEKNDFCDQILNNEDLTVFFCTLLDIETLFCFSTVNNRIKSYISISTILARKILNRIVGSLLSTVVSNQFISSNQLKELYHDHKDICINVYEHPFVCNPEFDCKCIKTKMVFIEAPTIIDQTPHKIKVDTLIHYKMTSRKMKLFHIIFNKTYISKNLKILIPFSNSRISSCFVTSCGIAQFIKQQKQINPDDSIILDTTQSKLWQTFELIVNLNTIILENDPLPTPIAVRSLNYFFDYLEEKFCFSNIANLINWDYFELMGDSVFEAIVAPSINTIHTFENDLNFFAHSISYDDYLQELLIFEKKLTEQFTKFIKCCTFYKTITYILVYSRYVKVKIHFIFTCLTTNIATILSSFDLSPVQISFNAKTLKITYTHGFIAFLHEGVAAVYNASKYKWNHSQISRILKYRHKGIKYWKIPKGIDAAIWKKQLNDTFVYKWYTQEYQQGIMVQIEGNTIHTLNEEDYMINDFSDKGCIKSHNHDETNIVKEYLRLCI